MKTRSVKGWDGTGHHIYHLFINISDKFKDLTYILKYFISIGLGTISHLVF